MKNFFSSHCWRILECLLIFAALPAAIAASRLHGWIVLILWSVSALSWYALKRQGYSWRKEWNASALTTAAIKSIFYRFIPYAVAMLVFAKITVPHQLFGLVLTRPHMWALIMVLYPLLSVIPQEILFRSFFLHRYAGLIPASYIRMANAIAFGWVHIIMHNWVAILFSGIGGWLFADTYKKTHSLAATCFEHALYGCYVFTIGLGMFFYHGAVR